MLKAYSDRTQRTSRCSPSSSRGSPDRPPEGRRDGERACARLPREAIFKALLKMLSAEFVVTWRVLSANDFGVPQTRRRLFVLAVRKDVAEAVGITSEFAASLLFPNPTHTGTTVRDAFADLNQSHEDVRPWIASARTTTIATAAARLPKSPAWLLRPNHVGLQVTGNYTLTRCSYDLPAPTLTVTGSNRADWPAPSIPSTTASSLSPN